eukprot:7391434-Prymnesium_polylepis.1
MLSAAVLLVPARQGALVEHAQELADTAFVYAAPPYALRWCPEIIGQGQATGTKTVTEALRSFPPSIVIDVGAYDGEDALEYATAGHQVYSFEPTPSKGDVIEAKYRMSPDAERIKFFRMALSNRSGTTDFWVSDSKGSQQDQMDKPAWEGARRVAVAIDTLDNVVGEKEVLYAKVDAQGHDPEVLGGARRLLQNHLVHVLTFEIYPSGCAADPYSYVRSVASLAQMRYRCFDCGRAGAAGDTTSWGMRSIVDKLNAKKISHRGQLISSWTNLVCMHEGGAASALHL